MVNKKEERIELKEVVIKSLQITIKGDSPLLMRRFSEKAKQQLLDIQNPHVNSSQNSISYGREVDIWSLGCICYELYFGKSISFSQSISLFLATSIIFWEIYENGNKYKIKSKKN